MYIDRYTSNVPEFSNFYLKNENVCKIIEILYSQCSKVYYVKNLV